MDSSSADEPLFGRSGGQGDSFYDASPEYDNQVNQNTSGGAEAATPIDPEARAKQEEEWKAELIKLEQEITTLKSVLNVKMAEANRLKHLLGITPIREFQNDFKQGIRNIKESETYQKTTEKVGQLGDAISTSDAYQKTGAALKTFGSWSSRKMSDARNSNLFKSVEEKVGGAYSNMKTKITGSKSENSFEDALSSSAAANNQDPSPDLSGSSEKVPL